jgi:hypothetical protein
LGEGGFFSGLVLFYFIFGIFEFLRNYLFKILKFKEITREGNIHQKKNCENARASCFKPIHH